MVVHWGVLIGELVAVAVWIAAVVFASKLAKRKHRSAAWSIVVLLFFPMVLILFLLPSLAAEGPGAIEKTAPQVQAHTSFASKPNQRSNQVLKGGDVLVLAAVGIYGWQAGWFEPAPQRCADISVWRMNSIYQDSVFGKMGLKIIDIESVADTGSTAAGLQCEVKAVTSHGEMGFAVSTRSINGQLYMEIKPNLF